MESIRGWVRFRTCLNVDAAAFIRVQRFSFEEESHKYDPSGIKKNFVPTFSNAILIQIVMSPINKKGNIL